jgi:hypothetical protein
MEFHRQGLKEKFLKMNLRVENKDSSLPSLSKCEWLFSKTALFPLAEFYSALGHRTRVAGGCVWFDGGAFSMMSIPTAVIPEISDAEVRKILTRTGKLAGVYRVAKAEGTTVPVFLLRDKNYGLASLQRQFRQQVVSASSRLEARECSLEEWQTLAVRCDRETFRRRMGPAGDSHPLLSPEVRQRAVCAARSVPGLRIHACFSGGEIVGYLVHLTFGGMCEGLLANRVDSMAGAVDRHASHLLYFSFAQSALARTEVQAVCVGRQSIPANEPLGRFKRHAGYLFEPCHLRIHLHPWLAPFLENHVASALMRRIRLRLAGKFPALSNLEVMERAGVRG